MKSTKILIISLILVVVILGGALGVFIATTSNAPKKTYTYDPGDFFVTNVTDSDSLIKSDLVIEVSSKATLKYFTKNEAKVRDTVIDILRSKTLEQIQARDAQTKIKKEIIKALEKNYSVTGVENIYFNEFVFQQ